MRDSEGGLLLLSLLVGAGAGVGAVIFRWLIVTFTKFLSGAHDYSAAGHAAHPAVPWLGMYFVVFAPVVAGLLYGPLVYFLAREARGHGVPEVMYAVARKGGKIKPRVAVVKALASALCIGGGGSVGREGPIVQIGSALGSTLGTYTRMPRSRMRVLVACGAAGGIAATFNAPLAGVFFAMELILTDFAARSFGMVVISSVTASVIGRAAFGDNPFLRLPAFHVMHVTDYLLFALLGVIAGLVGVAFTRVLYAIEDACDWAWRWPEWARPAVGGLLLGLLLLAIPQMYGVGYPVLSKGVAGGYALGFLLVLLVAKMVACSLTIGIGGSGGVFAPSLFIGAMLGAAFGEVVGKISPGMVGEVGAFGLIGMGAVFAGSARAPITAVVILFELTGEYTIILPLMTAIVLATGVSAAISKDTVYTLKLIRRGVDISARQTGAARAAEVPVSSVMVPVPEPLTLDTSLLAAAQRLADARSATLPVVDAQGRFLGVVTGADVADALAGQDETEHDMTLQDLIVMPRTVRTGDSLADAVTALDEGTTTVVPVLAEEGETLAGWLTSRSTLGSLWRHVSAS